MVINLLITGGALYTGVKYWQSKQKDENKKFVESIRRLKNRNEGAIKLYPSFDGIDNFAQNIKKVVVPSFLTTRHDEQTQEIVATETALELSDEEIEANRKISLSLVSLGLTTGGLFLNAPLTVLSVPLLAYLSWDIMRDGYRMLFEERKIGLAVLDAVLTGGILLYGYWFAASIFFVFFNLGFKLLHQTRDNSKQNLINILGEEPTTVWIQTNNAQEGEIELEIPFEQLTLGDVVIVNAGEMIPIDGIIVEGFTSIDQHMLTGETQPAEKKPGDTVFAATVVLSGRTYIRVTKTGEETVVAKIGEILSHTADFKSSVESRGETISNQSALPILALGALSFPFLGAHGVLSVLCANFGYNLRIIASLSTLNFLHVLSKNGILVKDGRVLELLSQVDTVVFDKTGTLTLDQLHVGKIHTFHGHDEELLLTYAAAAEAKQSHPIARAILQAAHERNLEFMEIQQTNLKMGFGIKASLAEQEIMIGSARYMELEGIPLPPAVQAIQTSCHAQGYTVVYIAINSQLTGALELRPTIRAEAHQIVHALQQRNMTTYIISGDHEGPTKKLAQELGIDQYFAETLPQDKAALIEQLQAEGRVVCFVGDGINDSIALKKANVSISLRGASTIATDTAQIILMDADLSKLNFLFDRALDYQSNMNVNLASTIGPGFLKIVGAFLWHLGPLGATLLSITSLGGGVMNSMLPLWSEQQRSQKKDNRQLKENNMQIKGKV